MTKCQGCGTPHAPGYEGDPGVAGCSNCPPSLCSDCGQVDSMDSHCSCWVAIADMPLADVKAIFAGDGTFNVGGDGRVTVAD